MRRSGTGERCDQVADLVFDVGMHNGDDTAFYLYRGFRVAAVDANPLMCKAAHDRFRREVEIGRLTIRNVGIAEHAGEMTFWQSSHTEWSSFHKENAIKGGASASAISVQTVPFRQLLADEGIPKFVKIDIEVNDSLCLTALQGLEVLPPYISIVSNVHDAGDDIELLFDIGYKHFKCIRRNDHREITPRNVVFQEEFRRTMAKLASSGRPLQQGSRVLNKLQYRRERSDGWRFANGSSGPPGMDLSGRWLDRREVLTVWHHLIAYDTQLEAGVLGEWFDIHAAIGG